jgi:hypothetical protein
VRFPLPDADDDLPESLAEIAQDMKNSYFRATPENWYKPHDNWHQLSPVLSGDLNTDSDAFNDVTGDLGSKASLHHLSHTERLHRACCHAGLLRGDH